MQLSRLQPAFLVVLGAAVGFSLNAARPAVAQLGGSLPAFVKLQSATPGTQQTGHANISGTAIVGGLKMSAGAAAGKVMTSDASGGASWQPATGLTLPFVATQTDAGGALLDLHNSSGASGTVAVRGSADTPSGIGVLGSGIYGVEGDSSGAGVGVLGRNAVTGVEGLGTAIGVYGAASLTTDEVYGVRGDTSSDNGFGVFGLALTNGYGVVGRSDGATGTGVLGWGRGGGVGVYAESSSTAVYGHSSDGYGVAGRSDGQFGYGVYGSSPNCGVYGYGGSGTGVAAKSDSYLGVEAIGYTYGVKAYAFNHTGTTAIGVWALGDTYGVFSAGNLGAAGTKSFRIDHPLDPSHKYLLHYCAEGPEPRDVYQGHVRTGADGYAWVQLPDYYQAINRDPEYTLTVLDDGADFVLAKVVREVQGNRFQIRTSRPNVKVSWRVEGVRNDRWVAKHGAPVEVEKQGREYGTYTDPSLYGEPEEKSASYQPTVHRRP